MQFEYFNYEANSAMDEVRYYLQRKVGTDRFCFFFFFQSPYKITTVFLRTLRPCVATVRWNLIIVHNWPLSQFLWTRKILRCRAWMMHAAPRLDSILEKIIWIKNIVHLLRYYHFKLKRDRGNYNFFFKTIWMMIQFANRIIIVAR